MAESLFDNALLGPIQYDRIARNQFSQNELEELFQVCELLPKLLFDRDAQFCRQS